MKPFDLEKALSGEPVKLRNGSKAFVIGNIPDEYITDYPLIGYLVNECDCVISSRAWTRRGMEFTTISESARDIVGMWSNPQPQVTITIPAPLKNVEVGQRVWVLTGDGTRLSFVVTERYRDLITTGALFAAEEDVIAFRNALSEAKQ